MRIQMDRIAMIWITVVLPSIRSGCDTFIAMMKATEFGNFNDRSTFHRLTLNRAMLFERRMRTWSVEN
jgi:hypothetical protein